MLGSEVVDQVAAEDCDGAVRKADCDLGKVIESGESRDLSTLVQDPILISDRRSVYRELALCVADADGAEAGGHVRLLDELVQRPCLEHRFRAQILLVEHQRPRSSAI